MPKTSNSPPDWPKFLGRLVNSKNPGLLNQVAWDQTGQCVVIIIWALGTAGRKPFCMADPLCAPWAVSDRGPASGHAHFMPLKTVDQRFQTSAFDADS